MATLTQGDREEKERDLCCGSHSTNNHPDLNENLSVHFSLLMNIATFNGAMVDNSGV